MTHLCRLLLVAALILTIVMALVPHEPKMLDAAVDKYQHAAAFGALALLAALAYPQASLFRMGERLSFLGALIEVVQAMPQIHRDCDIYDWATDTIAAAAMLILIHYARRSEARAPVNDEPAQDEDSDSAVEVAEAPWSGERS